MMVIYFCGDLRLESCLFPEENVELKGSNLCWGCQVRHANAMAIQKAS
jgi:hypothetical protein